MPVLTRLAAVHPGLELELDFRDRLVNLAEDGFDLAIRNGPLGSAAGLMRRRIMREEMVVCAASGYAGQWGLPDGVPDLERHPAVTHVRNGRVQAWLFPRDGMPPIEVTPSTRLRFDDLGAILDAAVAGHGLAWLPDWLVRERIRSGDLVRVLPQVPSLFADIHAV